MHVVTQVESPSHLPHTFHHLNAIAESPKITEEHISSSSSPESGDNNLSNDKDSDDSVDTGNDHKKPTSLITTTNSKDADKSDKNITDDDDDDDDDDHSSLHSIQSIINELEANMKQSADEDCYVDEETDKTEEGTTASTTASRTESPALSLQISSGHSGLQSTTSLKVAEVVTKPSYNASVSMPVGSDDSTAGHRVTTTTAFSPPPIPPPRTKEKTRFFPFSLGSSSSSSSASKDDKKKRKTDKKSARISVDSEPSSTTATEDVVDGGGGGGGRRSRQSSGNSKSEDLGVKSLTSSTSSCSMTPRRTVVKCRSKPVDYCYVSDNEVSAHKRTTTTTTTTTEDISSKDLEPISPEPPSSVLQDGDDEVFDLCESSTLNTAQEALVFDFATTTTNSQSKPTKTEQHQTSLDEIKSPKTTSVTSEEGAPLKSDADQQVNKVEVIFETCKVGVKKAQQNKPAMPIELLQFANKSNFVMAKHHFLDFTLSDSGSNSSHSLMKGLIREYCPSPILPLPFQTVSPTVDHLWSFRPSLTYLKLNLITS